MLRKLMRRGKQPSYHSAELALKALEHAGTRLSSIPNRVTPAELLEEMFLEQRNAMLSEDEEWGAN